MQFISGLKPLGLHVYPQAEKTKKRKLQWLELKIQHKLTSYPKSLSTFSITDK
jgi:hypothetical protein